MILIEAVSILITTILNFDFPLLKPTNILQLLPFIGLCITSDYKRSLASIFRVTVAN